MSENREKGFVTGFFLGSVLAYTAGFLTFTKSGRKITQAFLKAAEEWGEKGEAYLDKHGGWMGAFEEKKETVKNTMSSLMGKLTDESK